MFPSRSSIVLHFIFRSLIHFKSFLHMVPPWGCAECIIVRLFVGKLVLSPTLLLAPFVKIICPYVSRIILSFMFCPVDASVHLVPGPHWQLTVGF